MRHDAVPGVPWGCDVLPYLPQPCMPVALQQHAHLIMLLHSACMHHAAGLAPLISQHGPPERLLSKCSSCFVSLAKSILYQQLAGTAAAAIYSRFLAVCGVGERLCSTPCSGVASQCCVLDLFGGCVLLLQLCLAVCLQPCTLAPPMHAGWATLMTSSCHHTCYATGA
jgi:hypothetical protein